MYCKPRLQQPFSDSDSETVTDIIICKKSYENRINDYLEKRHTCYNITEMT